MCTDYDPPDLYVATFRTARKQHLCFECGRRIEVSERYEVVFGVWEGRADTMKTCEQCTVARDLLMRWCQGFMHGSVLEELHDHLQESFVPVYRLGRLLAMAKRRWVWRGARLALVDVEIMRDAVQSKVDDYWAAELAEHNAWRAARSMEPISMGRLMRTR